MDILTRREGSGDLKRARINVDQHAASTGSNPNRASCLAANCSKQQHGEEGCALQLSWRGGVHASPSASAASSSLRKPSFSSHSICSAVGFEASTCLSAQGCRASSAHASSCAAPAARARLAASSARSSVVFRRLACPAMVYTLSPAAAAHAFSARASGQLPGKKPGASTQGHG